MGKREEVAAALYCWGHGRTGNCDNCRYARTSGLACRVSKLFRDAEREIQQIIEREEHAMWECIDAEYNVWTCRECGYLTRFEADGPMENGVDFCPRCGKKVVIASENEDEPEE